MPERRIDAELRQQVSVRAGGCCEYCRSQAHYATQSFSVEHILPRVQGGATTLDNLALACQGCNNHKYDNVAAPDPVSGQLAPLYHPRRDRWDMHFAWSDESPDDWDHADWPRHCRYPVAQPRWRGQPAPPALRDRTASAADSSNNRRLINFHTCGVPIEERA